jgi:Ca2+-binding EF-hand superfamily protein
MMRMFLSVAVSGVVCLACVSMAPAQEATKTRQAVKAPAPVKSPPVPAAKTLPLGKPLEGDVQDFVFLDTGRPVFIRLHIQIDGLGFRKAWEKFTERFFDFADTNKDGALTSQEFQAAARWNVAPMQFANFDTAPRDGRVSRTEFTAKLAKASDAMFSAGNANQMLQQQVVFAGMARGNRPNPGAELSKLLDVNRDGALTQDELAGASQTLRKLDLDDDELIAASELRPYDSNLNYGFAVARPVKQPAQPPAPNLVPLSPSGNAAAVARQLVDRYGAASGKAGKLTREEIGLDKEQFREADADGDGHLDLEEVSQLCRRPVPQLTLLVRLGSDALRLGRFALVAQDGKAPPLAQNARQNPDNTLTLDLGTAHLQFSAMSVGMFPGGNEKFFEDEFKRADRDNNKYLDKNETRQVPIAGQFDLVDRDGNGMIFVEEYVAYRKQASEISQSRVAISGTDQGKLLFDVMDANRDGQLSQRELAEAPAKLHLWDRNHDRKLVPDEIPYQYAVSIGRGGAPNQIAPTQAAVFVAPGMVARAPTNPPMGAPAWFQKMDRNRDGDISPREFLGTSEEFKRLDADGNGLIDPQEAARAR